MGCIRWTVCTTGSIYFHGKYIKKSAADRQSNDRSVRGDTAECCSVSEISSVTLHLAERTPLIPAKESISTATLRTLSSSRYGLLGSFDVSAELHGVTLKDCNLSVDHLEQFHAQGFGQHLHRQNQVLSELPAPS